MSPIAVQDSIGDALARSRKFALALGGNDNHRAVRKSNSAATAEHAYQRDPNVVYVLACRIFALACVAALFGLLAHYPPGGLYVGVALACYGVLLWLRPAIWLCIVPALLPVLDFSAWTGWLYVRESDFLVLVTLAVGYWKIAPQLSPRRVSPAALLLLALLTGSHAISAYLGLGGLPPVDVNAFSNYQSPFNSVRVFWGFMSAILLLPLLTRSLGDDETNTKRYLYPGIALGLGVAALVTLWERIAFAGLLDFAGDYRATGSFSEMHVGGAALDGYLILTLPFAAMWAMSSRSVIAVCSAGALFALGTYAVLATYTRSTYLAYVVVVAVALAGFLVVSRSTYSPGRTRRLLILIFLALLFYALTRVFITGGYRTLAAAIGVIAAAYFAGAIKHRNQSGKAIALAAMAAGVVMIVLMFGWGASVYFSYSVALSLLGLGLLKFWLDHGRQSGGGLVLTSFPLLLLGMLLIAWHWGGDVAVYDAFFAAAFAVCIAAFNRIAARPLWSLTREHGVVMIVFVLASAMIIPVVNNDRMQHRFTEISNDFATRISHWRDGVALIAPGTSIAAFGMGLGSFPRAYFWGNKASEIPGVHTYQSENGGTHLRLGAALYKIGYGESIRVFQMVTLQPWRTYRLSFDLRSNANTVLLSEVCEKWLIYPIGCATFQGSPATKVETGEWKRVEKNFTSGEMGQWRWFGKRTVHLSLAVENQNTYVEVDNVRLFDDSGRDLIRNGDFSNGHSWWYFSSDRHHLPWHAKNMLLHVLFEQGWVGVLLICWLLIYALREFARRIVDSDLHAVAPLAGISGFLLVGAFDSLLDFPRLTLMFYLVLFLAAIPKLAKDRGAIPIKNAK